MSLWIRSSVLIALCLVASACGGPQDAADSPSDVDSTEAEGTEAETPAPAAGKDGIIRDADGDGVPDDANASNCDGKNETQCKINMACAWSDDGKCVTASAGPM